MSLLNFLNLAHNYLKMELHLFCQKANFFEWKDINIPDLNHYTNKINTNTYHDYNIPDQYFQDEDAYKRASDMRVSCESIFQIQHLI